MGENSRPAVAEEGSRLRRGAGLAEGAGRPERGVPERRITRQAGGCASCHACSVSPAGQALRGRWAAKAARRQAPGSVRRKKDPYSERAEGFSPGSAWRYACRPARGAGLLTRVRCGEGGGTSPGRWMRLQSSETGRRPRCSRLHIRQDHRPMRPAMPTRTLSRSCGPGTRRRYRSWWASGHRPCSASRGRSLTARNLRRMSFRTPGSGC